MIDDSKNTKYVEVFKLLSKSIQILESIGDKDLANQIKEKRDLINSDIERIMGDIRANL